MQIQGRISKVMQPVGGTSKAGKQWSKQDFVIECQNGQYQKHIALNIFGEDKIQQFALREGENVIVDFDVDAHEYNGRWLNEIRAWNITRQVTQAQMYATGAPVIQQAPASPYGTAQQMVGGPQYGAQAVMQNAQAAVNQQPSQQQEPQLPF